MSSSGRSISAELYASAPDHGFITWSHDPAMSPGGFQLATAGLLYVVRLRVPYATTITNVVAQVTTAGATLTSGQCFAALFSSARAHLSSTATQHTAWESTGTKTMALSVAQAVAAGFVWAGVYANGTTMPTFARAGNVSAGTINVGLAAPNFRYASADTGLTTAMPSSIGTQTAATSSIWIGLS